MTEEERRDGEPVAPPEPGPRQAVVAGSVAADAAVGTSPSADTAPATPPPAISEAPPAPARAPKSVATARRRPKRTSDFESLLLAELGRTVELRKGDRIRGRITRIEADHATVDYGGGAEAILKLDGTQDADGKSEIEVGQLLTLTVTETGDRLVVGRAGRAGRERARLRKLFQSETPVEGKVSATNKGGFDVQISSFRAFCPISQIDVVYCENAAEHVGKQYMFKIVEFKDGGRRFVVSRRALLERDRTQRATETRASLAVGQELDGRVVRLQPFGAFVDIGGLEGLVHVSELRHERVVDPKTVVAVGDPLRVKVIGLENVGAAKGERISLSAKALQQDPWLEASRRLAPGQVVQGRVVRLLDYGAFVEIEAGIEGLVHITEFSHRRIRHPSDLVKEGQTVDAKVLQVDTDRRRISLSLKDSGLTEIAAPRPSVKVGTIVEGVVTNVKPYGVFVRLGEPAVGMDGMVPVDETELDAGADLAEAFPNGKELRAKVIRVDQRGRIRLSIRALHGPSAADVAAEAVQTPPPSFGIMADAFKKARN